MESRDWLLDLPATQDSMMLERIARSDLARTAAHRSQTQWRRRQGQRVKNLLCQSPAATIIPGLLLDMQQALGVHLDLHSLENPGCRLVWEVTFDYKAPWTYRYFIVQRLFAGRELDPGGCHYLGPDWEVPEAWLGYTDEQIGQLVSQEEVAVCSAAGERRVAVADAGWVARLQSALREAYRHPFQQCIAP